MWCQISKLHSIRESVREVCEVNWLCRNGNCWTRIPCHRRPPRDLMLRMAQGGVRLLEFYVNFVQNQSEIVTRVFWGHCTRISCRRRPPNDLVLRMAKVGPRLLDTYANFVQKSVENQSSGGFWGRRIWIAVSAEDILN